MDAAVARIGLALERRESVLVYGDYDVDGITSTAIVASAFGFLGAGIDTYIPHRLDEGYGLNVEAIRKFAERGVKLLITVDNGITAIEEVAEANRLGVDVIVTDHHEPGENLPPAVAVIDPKQPGCDYPFKELCGAGVAFKLAHAMLKSRGVEANDAKQFLRSQLDLVALGTVADIVPLKDENRRLVANGMPVLRDGARVGLQQLAQLINVPIEEVTTGDLAFKISPRLNAAGRTDHAERALELLVTEDTNRARELSSMLDRFNSDRRRIEADITEEAFGLIDEASDSPVIVVHSEGWHPGVIGIVASRILERYHRPAIVLGIENGWAKGSARSVRGFDVHAALDACSGHLERFGGHTMAAGLRLRSSALADFCASLDVHARGALPSEALIPSLRIDATATCEDLTMDNARALEKLEPFGMANARPVIAIEGLTLVEEPRILKGRHIKLHLAGPDGRSVWAIGFAMADRADELRAGCKNLRLAATPFVNRWAGRTNLELQLKDFSTGK